MLLRGKATEDQLQFNPEIEKSAKSNRKKEKAKKKQGAQSDSLQSKKRERRAFQEQRALGLILDLEKRVDMNNEKYDVSKE
ncbi:hypothetical protein Lal_00012443, partial [Lupinus albus]